MAHIVILFHEGKALVLVIVAVSVNRINRSDDKAPLLSV